MIGKFDSRGMKAISAAKEKHAETLNQLMSKPFVVTNTEQLDAIKNYVIDFEFITHQMYLFRGLSIGLFGVWGISLTAQYLIPYWVQAILTGVFYLGGAGYVCKNFRMNDFHSQFTDMQKIYNWALKNGQEKYDGTTNNTDKLNNPVIQRLTKALSPFADFEFMQAWPKITENDQKNMLGRFYERFFSSADINPTNATLALQTQVEKNEFAMDFLSALSQSIKYFTQDPDARIALRNTAWEHMKNPLIQVQESAMSMYSEITHLKMS